MWQQILQNVRSYDTPQINMIATSCTLGGGVLLVYWLLSRHRMKTLEMGEGWWGPGERPTRDKEDEEIRPFQVQTSEKEIQDLHLCLDLARYTPPLEGAAFNYGFNSNYLKKVVSYWRNQFDWQKQVKILNQYSHYKTTIEGIEVHFIHVKASPSSNAKAVRPLLMVHGWPGSFYEFYKIIPLLTDPAAHGLHGEDVVFEVICPSIPGYGFSEAPHKQGFDTLAAARIFHKLMQRLGFQEYYLQGGDWGSRITTNMAQMLPNRIKGLHLNMVFESNIGLSGLVSLLLGAYVPWLVGLTREDARRLFPYFKKHVYTILRESGYLHIQATKPDTAGCGLNNSPVGLAAYILEKFSTWTDNSFLNLDDGGLERKYSLDDLLTNVMIYWVTSSIVPSMRFYKENLSQNPNTLPDARIAVHVPTGIAAFPNELAHVPRSWAKRKFKNIVTYSYMPQGGHFAAFEQPQLLAQDIRQFVKKVEHL
ncbi:epoxide hydrolase 1-like [Varanus komodoensis]|uniref:Epoxide hydrolase n=1 Tax=Varanus komodoensis TaxID=61221 RepID=A0A8D2J892_VARKO|nr:epoxide hydrolase 1-like [Varanus komodoensis]XP_044303701.1 epoxide hydrolase 1-like [Varanus komodoensis]XP_044303787.1 epoxide hydrolase 1-like [Varanus komodoensis]